MGNRLTKIYTRTGDSGETGLGDGSRIAKTASRVEAMGNADELNSVLGILVDEPLPEPISECLFNVQHTLFDIGGELSIPGHNLVKPDQVVYLEQTLDQLNKDLPPLKDFILPGGARSAAVCHLARSVCRRLERSLFAVDDQQSVTTVTLQYVNRLSDLLFVIARTLNQKAGEPDVLWDHVRQSKSDSTNS